jgi:glucose-1-phosphate cytidylyltransferase
MKVVILAGGLGTRFREETITRPKPMVEIGGKPMLWHIMKLYSHYNFMDFVICLGYKGYMIKEYFANYLLHTSDITIDMIENSISTHRCFAEPWRVSLIDTGDTTMTGGRIKRIKEFIGDETFMMTYGDGVSNVNINELLKFHKQHGKIATVTSIVPSGKFGALTIENDIVTRFREKPKDEGTYVSGGFFVFEPSVFDYIDGDNITLEHEPLQMLTKEGQLASYKHDDFWHSMDTMYEKNELETMWNSGKAPWKVWK